MTFAITTLTFMPEEPAQAAVDYGVHDINTPTNWNGRKVYISPGHFPDDTRPFPCGAAQTSEYTEAWHHGYGLRDYLFARGYQVMMPRRISDVAYTTRLQTARNWWSSPGNGRFAYVTMHSNGHGSFSGCSHDGTNQHGGTQYLYHTGAQQSVGTQPYRRIANFSPGTVHENPVGNFCNIRAITELCSTDAQALPIAYMELDFHDTQAGADFVTHHDRVGYNDISNQLALGLDCYFLGASCI